MLPRSKISAPAKTAPAPFSSGAWRRWPRSSRKSWLSCITMQRRRAKPPRARPRAGRRASRFRRSTACRSGSRTSSRRAISRPRMARPSSKAGSHHRDAASVTALREAGAVILGKTVTTEFATAPAGTDAQSVGHAAHAGRLVLGLGRGDRQRHDRRRPWHAGARLDPPAGELLRLRRLQAEPRRDQSQRQP